MNIALVTLATALVALASVSAGSAAPSGPRIVQAVLLGAGPKWKPAVPPQDQDLGAHFAYVEGLFREKRLIANGPLEDGRGLYLYDIPATAIADVLAHDPGATGGVIAPLRTESWTLLFDGFGRTTGSVFFVLEYTSGANWKNGVPLARQPIEHHVAYMTALFKEGRVLAGGPLDDRHGRYIVTAPDKAAAEQIVAADPGVREGTFTVTALQWMPLHR